MGYEWNGIDCKGRQMDRTGCILTVCNGGGHVTTRSLCNPWQNWLNSKIRHIQNAKDITDMEYVFLVLAILNGCWAKVIYSEINSMIIQMILFFNVLKTSFKFDKLKNYSVGSKQTTVSTKNAPTKQMKIKQILFFRRIFLRSFRRFYRSDIFKGSPDSSNFNFEINVGKSRIRHRTTLKLNKVIFYRFWASNSSFNNWIAI